MAKFWKPGTSAPGEDLKEERNNDQLVSYNPNISLSMQKQRSSLPISRFRDHILWCVENHQTTVVVGETGCGKSTQIPQYLLEIGYAQREYKMAVTQPRRVACVTLSNRVADERGSMIGREVGYKIRFDDCWDPDVTKLLYLTDGMLIREIMQNPLLTQYSVVMIDEAHERSLNTDMLLGLLKKILKKRPELKLIVSSATLDAEMFADYFNLKTSDENSKNTSIILPLEGRSYPVDIHYTVKPVPNYVESTIDTIIKIHKHESSGDVLAFLTGVDEIEHVVKSLSERSRELSRDGMKLLVLPMHGSLPASYQMQVFQPAPRHTRKIVVATNIAEASITINGISYVVDCGYEKIMAFNPKTALSTLVITEISQSSAIQRSGRAGRVRAGKSYRLYTESSYDCLRKSEVAEIQRTDLSPVILQMKSLGIVNVVRFDFITRPPAQNVLLGVELLSALNALRDDGNLADPDGLRMAEFPLHPRFSRMLLSSVEMSCSDEIVTICAMCQIQNIFINNPNQRQKMEKTRRMFTSLEGDHLTLLNIYNAWIDSNKSRQFCSRYFLNHKGLLRAASIRQQLINVLKRFKLEINNSNGNGRTVLRCITQGLFSNAARLHHTGVGVYVTVRDQHQLRIHPNSVLYREIPPQWVVFNEVIKTNKEYMQDITVIERNWLSELAPHYYQFGTSRELAEKKMKLS